MEQENAKYFEKTDKLNEKLTDLILGLQKEVAELKEDTLVNAQHIKSIKTKNETNIGVVNDKLKEHIDCTSNLVEILEKEEETNKNNDYTTFLKTLLESDFKSLQNEAIEQTKREILNAKKIPAKSAGFNFGVVFNVISIISFVLVVAICLKYKLFFG